MSSIILYRLTELCPHISQPTRGIRILGSRNSEDSDKNRNKSIEKIKEPKINHILLSLFLILSPIYVFLSASSLSRTSPIKPSPVYARQYTTISESLKLKFSHFAI